MLYSILNKSTVLLQERPCTLQSAYFLGKRRGVNDAIGVTSEQKHGTIVW